MLSSSKVKKSEKQSFLKVVSTLLVFTFLFQEFAIAAPELFKINLQGQEESEVSKAWARKLLPSLSESVATIEDAWKAIKVDGGKRSNTLVYLIQDAHTNESGQINIAKTLDIILKGYQNEGRGSWIADDEKESNPPLATRHPRSAFHIFLEAGIGNDSLSFLRKYADLDKRKEVAKSFLKKGLLHGPEYLDLTSEHDFMLWGVEDIPLYMKALEAYRYTAGQRGKFESYLNQIQSAIKTLKARIYNPWLLSFDAQYERYLKEDLSLTDFFEILEREASRNNISLQNYPHLKHLNELKQKESKIDFKKASQEQAEAILSLPEADQKELTELSKTQQSPFKLSTQEHNEVKGFYALLEQKLSQNPSNKFPNLFEYFNYLKAARKIDVEKIFNEEKSLETEIFKTLTKSSDEANLLKSSRQLRFLRKLFDLRMTPEEFETYQKESSQWNIVKLTGFLNRKIMDLRQYYEDATFLENGFDEVVQKAEEFYKITHDRDKAFLKNMLTKMSKESQTKAVLVAGGYHTSHLKSLLKKANISYISIRPQVYAETNHKKYEKILLNQKFSPEINRYITNASEASSSSLKNMTSLRPTQGFLGDMPIVHIIGPIGLPGLATALTPSPNEALKEVSSRLAAVVPDVVPSSALPLPKGARLAEINDPRSGIRKFYVSLDELPPVINQLAHLAEISQLARPDSLVAPAVLYRVDESNSIHLTARTVPEKKSAEGSEELTDIGTNAARGLISSQDPRIRSLPLPSHFIVSSSPHTNDRITRIEVAPIFTSQDLLPHLNQALDEILKNNPIGRFSQEPPSAKKEHKEHYVIRVRLIEERIGKELTDSTIQVGAMTWSQTSHYNPNKESDIVYTGILWIDANTNPTTIPDLLAAKAFSLPKIVDYEFEMNKVVFPLKTFFVEKTESSSKAQGARLTKQVTFEKDKKNTFVEKRATKYFNDLLKGALKYSTIPTIEFTYSGTSASSEITRDKKSINLLNALKKAEQKFKEFILGLTQKEVEDVIVSLESNATLRKKYETLKLYKDTIALLKKLSKDETFVAVEVSFSPGDKIQAVLAEKFSKLQSTYSFQTTNLYLVLTLVNHAQHQSNLFKETGFQLLHDSSHRWVLKTPADLTLFNRYVETINEEAKKPANNQSSISIPTTMRIITQADLIGRAEPLGAGARLALKVKKVEARVVKTFGDKDTVRVDIEVSDPKTKKIGRGHYVVPAGTSAGAFERKTSESMIEVQAQIALIKQRVPEDMAADDLVAIGQLMLRMHENEGIFLSAQATIGFQIALAQAVADAREQKLNQFTEEKLVPDLAPKGVAKIDDQSNITNGGVHAKNALDMQEFMIVAHGANQSEKRQMVLNVDRKLGEIYHALGLVADPNDGGVGDKRGLEGGYKIEDLTKGKLDYIYANYVVIKTRAGDILKHLDLSRLAINKIGVHRFVLEAMRAAVLSAGYQLNKTRKVGSVAIALDPATNEMKLLDKNEKWTGYYKYEGRRITHKQLTDIFLKWSKDFPILSIEDGQWEDGWDAWLDMIERFADTGVTLIGDDLLVTQAERIVELLNRMEKRGMLEADGTIKKKYKLGILIKVNQNGFLTTGYNDPQEGYMGTLEVIRFARTMGFQVIVISHRSKEALPEDDNSAIADIAAAVGADYAKIGDPVQPTRRIFYDRLDEIERAGARLSSEANTTIEPVHFGINGVGRIGTNLIVAWLQSSYNADVDALNDVGFDLKKYGIESVKSYQKDVLWPEFHKAFGYLGANAIKLDSYMEDGKYLLSINGHKIRVTDEAEPSKIAWNEVGVTAVFDGTGKFNNKVAASKHKEAGAKNVFITAPAEGGVPAIIAATNPEAIKPEEVINGCASCTTGSIAPPIKVLLKEFGVVRGFINTTHAYTQDQFSLTGLRPKAPQRGRGAAGSMVYTTTGAAKMIGKIFPELEGKLDGFAVRVPVENGSATTLVLELKKNATKEQVNAVLKKASEDELKGIMAYTDQEFVSVDILGRPESSIIHGKATNVIGDNMVQLLASYDNEFGFSSRAWDTAASVMNIPTRKLEPKRAGIIQRELPPAVLKMIEENITTINKGIRAEKSTGARLALSTDLPGLVNNIKDTVTVVQNVVQISDKDQFRDKTLPYLVSEARFSKNKNIRESAAWLIRAAGLQNFHVYEASEYNLYEERNNGNEKLKHHTMASYNLRVNTYETARVNIRAAMEQKVGFVAFELASSETRYTDQTPGEYVAMIYAAAIAEKYEGPIFLLADHYQTKINDEKNIKTVQANFTKAMEAGKMSLDIDSSPLVDIDTFRKIVAMERKATTNYITQRMAVDDGFNSWIDQNGGLKEDSNYKDETREIKALRRQLVDDLEAVALVGMAPKLQGYVDSIEADLSTNPQGSIERFGINVRDYQKSLTKYGIGNEDAEKILPLYRLMQQPNFEVSIKHLRHITAEKNRLGWKVNPSIGIESLHIDNEEHKDFPSTIIGSMVLTQLVMNKVKEEGLIKPTKLANQTGAMHGSGGDVDWSIFDRHDRASDAIGLRTFVQHGTSKTPEETFDQMPRVGVGEAHLATKYQEIWLGSIAKDPITGDLAEQMAQYLEGLMDPERITSEPIRQKIRKAGLEGKSKDYVKYADKWAAAFRQTGKSRADVIHEIFGDTLPKKFEKIELKTKLKDLTKEVTAPFKEELAGLPENVQEPVLQELFAEFSRINIALNNIDTSELILGYVGHTAEDVVLPESPQALQEALVAASSESKGARLAGFGENAFLKIPLTLAISQNFSPALLESGLTLIRLEAFQIKGSKTPEEIQEALDDIVIQFIVGTASTQAFGSYPFIGQGKGKKEVADNTSVHFGNENTRIFTKNNPKVAVVNLAAEGFRDGSKSANVGNIYFNGKEEIFSSVIEVDGKPEIQVNSEALQQRLEELRSQEVTILYIVQDALELTNGIVPEDAVRVPTNSVSLFAAFIERPALTAKLRARGKTYLDGVYRYIVPDEARIAGISYSSPADATIDFGLTALDLPSEALPKIAKARGETLESFLNHTILLILGPRDADLKKGNEGKHAALINDARAVQSRHAATAPKFKILTPGDGDHLARDLSSLGIDLDGMGMVVIDRSGSTEATAAQIPVINDKDGQFVHTLVATEATDSGLSRQTAFQYTPLEKDRFTRYGVNPKAFMDEVTSTRTKKDFADEEGVLAVTSVTGANPDDYSQPYADLHRRLQFDEATSTARTSTLVSIKNCTLLLRATYSSKNIPATIKVLRTAIQQPDSQDAPLAVTDSVVKIDKALLDGILQQMLVIRKGVLTEAGRVDQENENEMWTKLVKWIGQDYYGLSRLFLRGDKVVGYVIVTLPEDSGIGDSVTIQELLVFDESNPSLQNTKTIIREMMLSMASDLTQSSKMTGLKKVTFKTEGEGSAMYSFLKELGFEPITPNSTTLTVLADELLKPQLTPIGARLTASKEGLDILAKESAATFFSHVGARLAKGSEKKLSLMNGPEVKIYSLKKDEDTLVVINQETQKQWKFNLSKQTFINLKKKARHTLSELSDDSADVIKHVFALHSENTNIPVKASVTVADRVLVMEGLPPYSENKAFWESLIFYFGRTIAPGGRVIIPSKDLNEAKKIAILAKTLVKNHEQFVPMTIEALLDENLSEKATPKSYLVQRSYLKVIQGIYGTDKKYFNLKLPEDENLLGVYAFAPLGVLMDLVSLNRWQLAADLYHKMTGKNLGLVKFKDSFLEGGALLIPFVSELLARLVNQVYRTERAVGSSA